MGTDLSRSIFSRFYHINRVLRRQAESMEAMSDLTLLQMQVLFFVKTHTRPMMRDLADELKISPSSATLLADRLISAGWLEREQDNEDRRAIYLRFSEKAKKKVDEIQERAMDHMGQLLDKVPARDLKELDRILGCIEELLLSSQQTPC